MIAVPEKDLARYKKLATAAGKVWIEHGALQYWECVGDDLGVKDMTSFPQLAQAGPDETVVFAWVVFESRAHRDQANEKIMADPRLRGIMDGDRPIFDYKRMAYGGFKELVHA
jgi:uncharacterized protein YbaA (DUF1428 family)